MAKGQDGGNPSCVDRDKRAVRTGDIVQITPEHDVFPCAFAAVIAAQGWGVVAEVYGPHRETFPVRLPTMEYVLVGHALWIIEGEGS
jgi:hypothetical protein